VLFRGASVVDVASVRVLSRGARDTREHNGQEGTSWVTPPRVVYITDAMCAAQSIPHLHVLPRIGSTPPVRKSDRLTQSMGRRMIAFNAERIGSITVTVRSLLICPVIKAQSVSLCSPSVIKARRFLLSARTHGFDGTAHCQAPSGAGK
jgi:hypothetical protein